MLNITQGQDYNSGLLISFLVLFPYKCLLWACPMVQAIHAVTCDRDAGTHHMGKLAVLPDLSLGGGMPHNDLYGSVSYRFS